MTRSQLSLAHSVKVRTEILESMDSVQWVER